MPSFSVLFSSPASHRGKSFTSTAGLIRAGFTAGVGVGNALDNVAADTTSHGETVANRGKVWFSVIGTDGLSDIVGPFVGINNLGVFEGLALSPQAVGGRQRMTESGFITGCSVLINPNDSHTIDNPGRCWGQF